MTEFELIKEKDDEKYKNKCKYCLVGYLYLNSLNTYQCSFCDRLFKVKRK